MPDKLEFRVNPVFAKLVQFGVITAQGGLSNDFKSLLAEKVKSWRYGKGSYDDDGPALVDAIIEATASTLTIPEVKQSLNIVVPLVQAELGGIMVMKDRNRRPGGFEVKKFY